MTTYQLSIWETAVMMFDCATCGAQAGELCRTLTSDLIALFPHAPRMNAMESVRNRGSDAVCTIVCSPFLFNAMKDANDLNAVAKRTRRVAI